MGDLSLLAVSLLHHNSVSQQQIPPNAAIAAVKTLTPAGQAMVTATAAAIATHQPEFSSVTVAPHQPLEQKLGSAARTAPFAAPGTAPVTAPGTAPPVVAQTTPPLHRRSPQPVTPIRGTSVISPTLPSTLTPPWLEPAPSHSPTVSDPSAAPATLNTPRPSSGSQLYRQRTVALRAGRTYTRLPVNSFWESWVQATQQPTYEQWVSLLAQEAGAMARGQGSNRLTVLLGDSLYLWYPPEQLTSDRFWLNQGISGDTTTGVLRRLSAFAQTRPDTIHVMVGINDLRRGASDAEVINNLHQIMRRLRQNHPQAQIYIHSILPTRLSAISSSRIHRINTTLAALAKQEEVNYLDLVNYFADAQGNLRRDLTTDGLHLNARGYATWQWAMANG